MTAAAFKGTYADFKLIKTRGVVSISFEIPLKDVDLALRALGGMPDAAKEQWFGIAALDMTKLNAGVTVAPISPVEAAGLCGESPDRPHSPRKPVAAEKRLAQQAGICASDPVFQRFLMEDRQITGPTEDQAAEYVRAFCRVASRSEIIPGTEAAARWDRLHGKFLAWKLVA